MGGDDCGGKGSLETVCRLVRRVIPAPEHDLGTLGIRCT